MNAFVQLGMSQMSADFLYHRGIKVPTLIQERAIPVLLKGKDVVGKSETGTGKTLAYLLPLVEKINSERGTQGVILTPTRELAKQIFEVLRPLAENRGVDAVDIIGGRTIENQLRKLKRDPHIVIGTPGRLVDHLRRGSIRLGEVKTIVLDEADQMLAAGFREDIEAVIDATPKRRQLCLFSATMPMEAKKIST